MKKLLTILLLIGCVNAYSQKSGLGNLPPRITIDQVTPLRDELNKKSNKGNIDNDQDVATDMLLVNTTTRHTLRIWLSAEQSQYRAAPPASRDMYVHVDNAILAMPNDWIQFSTSDPYNGCYCYEVTEPGPTGPIKVKKRAEYKQKLWISEQYKPNKKLILINLDSLKAPLNVHKSCTYSRPYYLYELTTTSPYFPLFIEAWAFSQASTSRARLHLADFSRRPKAPIERGNKPLVAAIAAPYPSQQISGRRCPLHQSTAFFFTPKTPKTPTT
jgi:hypothetical protein